MDARRLTGVLCGFALGLGLVLHGACAAEREVIHTLADQRAATASYHPGEADLSPVLLLHGFLQTRQFSTISRLSEGLADAGHTVLAPTLTLGLSHRKKSLDCEAIHTHDMDADLAEIDHWVRWLARESGRPVVLVGHSLGAVKLVAYLAAHPDAPVERAILVSLIYYGPGPVNMETREDIARARALVKAGAGNELNEFGLGYCNKYPTTPRKYLSYLAWDMDRVAGTAGRLPIPVQVILGDRDNRYAPDWKDRLAAEQVPILTVAGANHFFDQEHEFDLLDQVQALLEH